MIFTYDDQLMYAKLALSLFEIEKSTPKNLEKILDFGELIKKHSGDNNALIYDATEYVYEQLRLLRGEEGAYDDSKLRAQLEEVIKGSES